MVYRVLDNGYDEADAVMISKFHSFVSYKGRITDANIALVWIST